MKGAFERLARRKRALPDFDAAPAYVQGRVVAAGRPIRRQIAELIR